MNKKIAIKGILKLILFPVTWIVVAFLLPIDLIRMLGSNFQSDPLGMKFVSYFMNK